MSNLWKMLLSLQKQTTHLHQGPVLIVTQTTNAVKKSFGSSGRWHWDGNPAQEKSIRFQQQPLSRLEYRGRRLDTSAFFKWWNASARNIWIWRLDCCCFPVFEHPHYVGADVLVPPNTRNMSPWPDSPYKVTISGPFFQNIKAYDFTNWNSQPTVVVCTQ